MRGLSRIFLIMKQLEKKFESLGFSFSCIHREGIYSIYERKQIQSEYKHYEAIRIQSHNGYEMHGVKYPPSEYYPSANSWGAHGYTCLTKKDAFKRLDKMMEQDKLNKDKNKKNKTTQ